MPRRPKPTTPAEMRARAAELRAEVDRLHAHTESVTAAAPGAFVTGRSGRTAAMNRRTDRAIETTVKNASRCVALTKEADRLEAEAADIEAGGPERRYTERKAARAAEKVKEREERQKLKHGELAPRLFQGVYPGGIMYSDRAVQRSGDYRQLAFLSFATLELRFENDCPEYWKPFITEKAAAIQAKRGQEYQVSTSGQTVLLGGHD